MKLIIDIVSNKQINIILMPGTIVINCQQSELRGEKTDFEDHELYAHTAQPNNSDHHKPNSGRPSLDGLKQLVIIPVVLFNFEILPQYLAGAFMGIDASFVVWGFLIGSNIVQQSVEDRLHLPQFYKKGIKLFFPPIMFAVAIVLIILHQLNVSVLTYQQFLYEAIAALTSTSNLHSYLKGGLIVNSTYRINESRSWMFLHAWPFALGFQFFFLAPIAIWCIRSVTSKKNRYKLMFAFTMIVVLSSFALSVWSSLNHQMFAFYLLPCRVWQLGLGVLTAAILNQNSLEQIRKSKNFRSILKKLIKTRTFLQITGWLGLCLILLSYTLIDRQYMLHIHKSVFACCGATIFILSTFIHFEAEQCQKYQKMAAEFDEQERQIKRKYIHNLTSARLLSWKPLTVFGPICCSLYLWHWPMWVFWNYLTDLEELSSTNKLCCFLVCLLIANFSQQRIENSVTGLKKPGRSASSKTIIIIWALLMAILLYDIVLKPNPSQSNLPPPSKEKVSQQDQAYPAYDQSGYSLRSPYKSFTMSQYGLQKFAASVYVRPKQMLYSAHEKPILINYPEKEGEQSKRVCMAVIGSSHAEQHIETLTQLAYDYNISLLIVCRGGNRKHPNQQWENWLSRRFQQIKMFRPKTFFVGQALNYMKDNLQFFFEQTVSPLLTLKTRPEIVAIFGDNPYSDLMRTNATTGAVNFNKVQEFYENKQNWQFLAHEQSKQIHFQMKVEKKMAEFIKSHYDRSIVRFYPNLYQLLMDANTKRMQIAGSEVGGKLTFLDTNHLTVYGSRRLKHYFAEKLFKQAAKLCNQS